MSLKEGERTSSENGMRERDERKKKRWSLSVRGTQLA
jgi:hypothetical protein